MKSYILFFRKKPNYFNKNEENCIFQEHSNKIFVFFQLKKIVE